MYQPVDRSKLFERSVAQIRGRIARGELRAGDRLPPERALALGVLPFLLGDAVKVVLASAVVAGQRVLGRS